MRKLIISIVSFFVLLSCSLNSDVVNGKIIQKRKYVKGYYFGNKNIRNYNQNFYVAKADYQKYCGELPNNEKLIASINNDIIIEDLKITNNISEKPILSNRRIEKLNKKFNKKSDKLKNFVVDRVQECDIIIFNDGNEVSAKIIEITSYDVKYKRCDNIDGPTFTKSIGTIFKIKYSNGTEEVYGNNSNKTANNNNQDALGLGLEEGEKSQSIAIILWFFGGVIGLHRFYLGHIGMGVLYLLTAGLCGIGWLIDGILFLTGSLKPADGKDYGEKII